MFDNSYTQTLQDQIGQLSKLLGGQAAATAPAEGQKSADPCIYVAGIDGARSFLQKLLAGTKAVVWDNEKPMFYILAKDANGNPARIMIGEFSVKPEPSMEEKYVSRDDFNALAAKIDLLLTQQKEVTDNA